MADAYLVRPRTVSINAHKDGAPVITLTRLGGSRFALNSDLIERVDSTPDTVITLMDGTKYVVIEGLDEIVTAVRHYRGMIIAESSHLAATLDVRAVGEEAVVPPVPAARRLVAVSDETPGLHVAPRRTHGEA